MESVNYTYEKREVIKDCKVKKFHGYSNGMYTHEIGRFSGRAFYDSFVVLDKNGRKIAECSSRIKAELIVAALNGVAP